ncbi:MAG: hypothetical protein RLP45_01200 [Haliea sp.]
MKINHKDTAEIGGEAPHRPGGIKFHYLLTGEDGARDNFMLALVDFKDEYYTPRHRHNFEQVRVGLEGSYEWAPGTAQEAGTIGYFCEGTYYAQKGTGHSRHLLLQVAGPSGEGYMSHQQLREHGRKLQQKGEFHDGIYTWRDEQDRKHNKDGFEAVWEDVNGREIKYPKPRYEQPVLMRPENFDYVPVSAAPGVYERLLGRFNERGLLIKQVKMDAGSTLEVGGSPQSLLFYAISGSGSANGKAWRPESAFQVERNETVTIEADEAAEFHVLGLPVFSD